MRWLIGMAATMGATATAMATVSAADGAMAAPHASVIVAAAPQSPASRQDSAPTATQLTPAEKMRARFPQPVRVGDLIGLPVLDWDDRTIGYVRQVVRSPDGTIKLIVPYAAWFGWLGAGGYFDSYRRPVAVPIEVVAILGRQIDVLDMERAEFDSAPTWSATLGSPIPADERIHIAIGRR